MIRSGVSNALNASMRWGNLEDHHFGITPADVFNRHGRPRFPEDIPGPIDLRLAVVFHPQFPLQDVAGALTIMGMKRCLEPRWKGHPNDPRFGGAWGCLDFPLHEHLTAHRFR